MESSLSPLLPLYHRSRAGGQPLVLAIVLRTAGSTYRKPGALMLIATDGQYAGLLSGGCLEGDLRERARAVATTGEAAVVSYDMRGPDDLLWGLGVGCEGAMDILLVRVGPESGWQPLALFEDAWAHHRPEAIGVVATAAALDTPIGVIYALHATPPSGGHVRPAPPWLRPVLESAAAAATPVMLEHEGAETFVLPLALPPRILLLGAGPDALPVVELAARLGWKVTLCDHRPAYARSERFPLAERVLLADPEDLGDTIDLGAFAAAVVMSHHLSSDLEYLRVLAHSPLRYVGLLGPAPRREKLLADLGDDARDLRDRLRAPVGLAIGGRAPESIALAIVAEIHAFLNGRDGGAFSAEAGLG